MIEEGDMTHLYFAYGSNLNPEQMKQRCPDSQLIDVARLDGFQLAFAGYSKRWGGGVATVWEDPAGIVEGIVWLISDRDLELLDRCEGYPHSYGRVSLMVQMANGELKGAWVYVKQDHTSTRPSPAYIDVITKAYKCRGFNLSVLERATQR